jgi:predicted O-methyltransferase YrrM
MLIQRMYRYVQSGIFNASCGLRSQSLESLLSRCNHLDLTFDDWDRDAGAGSFWDLTAIVALTRRIDPSMCFEIGTGHGRTTLHLALNTRPESQIHTLDINQNDITGCMFRNTSAEAKITSWTGDSRTFDYSRWNKQVDLVYVDGSHEYEFVRADSRTAFGLVAKGGCILWDDFIPSWPGVARALRELPQADRLRRIAGTKLVCYLEPE